MPQFVFLSDADKSPVSEVIRLSPHKHINAAQATLKPLLLQLRHTCRRWVMDRMNGRLHPHSRAGRGLWCKFDANPVKCFCVGIL